MITTKERTAAAMPRWREVIKLRDEGLTYLEIGDRLGICKQRAQTLHQIALRRLADGVLSMVGEPK